MPDLSAVVDAADTLLRVSGALRTYLDDALTRHNVSWAGFEVLDAVCTQGPLSYRSLSHLLARHRTSIRSIVANLVVSGHVNRTLGTHRRDECIVGATLKGQRTFERSRNSIETASRDLLSQNDALGLLAHIVVWKDSCVSTNRPSADVAIVQRTSARSARTDDRSGNRTQERIVPAEVLFGADAVLGAKIVEPETEIWVFLDDAHFSESTAAYLSASTLGIPLTVGLFDYAPCDPRATDGSAHAGRTSDPAALVQALGCSVVECVPLADLDANHHRVHRDGGARSLSTETAGPAVVFVQVTEANQMVSHNGTSCDLRHP